MNKKDGIIYLIIIIIFITISAIIIKHTDLSNNVLLSKSIQVIIILFLIRVSYGCTLYIKKQYQKKKYSYDIVMNLGLLIFINLNILRQINLLILNSSETNIIDVYNNTINSFSYFVMLTLPCIIILAIYSIITNIILIRKESFTYRNFLGIILGVISLIGLFGSQGLYTLISNLLTGDHLFIKKLIDVLTNVTLSYFYTLIIATLYCNIKASRHIPSFDKDYIIILGCKIRKDGTLTPLLKARVDKAIEFAKMQKEHTDKDIIFVPSGGKGNDEVIEEAEAMKKYLIEQGINKKNIMVEGKSTNTLENMKYSNSIIIKDNKDAKVSFSTTNYHVFRSGVIANECGFDYEGMGSDTKWYFYTNALIREFIANIVEERKKHLGLIALIYISIIILILIGHHYQFISYV